MQILILGASSNIGTALAEAFASGNALILAGRNGGKLAHAVELCKSAGAAETKCVEVDFRLGVAPLLAVISGRQIDLIIDAASASSGKRDAELTASELPGLVSVDFISRTEIFDHVFLHQRSGPAVIFISTVLALVKSPGRTVYTALKELYGAYLKKLTETHAGIQLLVVYVGTVIETDRATDKPGELAAAVVQAYQEKRTELLYGLSGRLLLTLFNLQPIVFRWVTHVQRKIRTRLSSQP